MLRTIITVVVLFCLWLLMSGIYQGFIVMLGFIAAAIAVFVVRRMDDVADTGRLEIRLKILNTIFLILMNLIQNLKLQNQKKKF